MKVKEWIPVREPSLESEPGKKAWQSPNWKIYLSLHSRSYVFHASAGRLAVSLEQKRKKI